MLNIIWAGFFIVAFAFVGGELIVYAVNVHVNGKPIDYTVDGWFYCELYKPTYPDQ